MKGVGVLAFCCLIVGGFAYQYETKYFRQRVDHFSYTNDDTYMERYLLSKDNWVRGGPIFFYAGNEGDILMFANNTGLMWEWAPEFQAMIVFAEHRYYGVSQPYGKRAYDSPTHLGYLSTEQALADFAVLVDFLKQSIDGAKNSPVIVFGGSYGGMLAAWFRMKYPHVVDGALAASAPVLQFTGVTPCSVFYQIATKAYKRESQECPKVIRKSWGIVRNLSKTDSGLNFLTKTFGLCEPLTVDKLSNFTYWLEETWTNAAMTNYPYPTSFLMPVPANPVKEICKCMPDSSKPDNELIVDIFRGASIFQNYTGQTPCFNISVAGGASLGDEGWDFQTCTEMVMPMCSDNVNDMYDVVPWSFKDFSSNCQQKWGVTPQAEKAVQMYGGIHINASSNIIFSNGLLDPWSGGGVLQSLSDSLVAILIPEGAHHLDLRSSNPADPLSVVNARKLEKQLIKKWIKEARMYRSNN